MFNFEKAHNFMPHVSMMRPVSIMIEAKDDSILTINAIREVLEFENILQNDVHREKDLKTLS